MTFASRIQAVLMLLRTTPSCLRTENRDMIRKLHSRAKADAQGTGNMPTVQEAAFAQVLESNGFQYSAEGSPSIPGLYYVYQVHGSQQSIDFRVLETNGRGVIRHIDLDLKHTTSDIFFLNDGWFHKDVIYVITWERRTSAPRKTKTTELVTTIALGQEIPTAEEVEAMNELIAVKQKYNKECKGAGSLCTYVRFANRYKCDRFTTEYNEARWRGVCTDLKLAGS